MISSWPEASEKLDFAAEEAEMELIMRAIRAVRNRRAEMNVPPAKKSKLLILADRPQVFVDGQAFIKKLAYASELEILKETPADAAQMVSCVTEGATLYMPMKELVDLDKERERLNKERKNAEQQIEKIRAKLQNENFTSRAPEAVVAGERERLAKFEKLAENLKESLKNLDA